MLVYAEYNFLICPSCKRRYKQLKGVLSRGVPLFGPAEVKCKKCGSVAQTNLKAWNELSTGKKIGIVLREFIAPTCAGSIVVEFLMNMFAFAMIAMPFPLILFPLAIEFKETSPALSLFFMSLASFGPLLFYFALLFFRLRSMIKESNNYLTAKQPGTW